MNEPKQPNDETYQLLLAPPEEDEERAAEVVRERAREIREAKGHWFEDED